MKKIALRLGLMGLLGVLSLLLMPFEQIVSAPLPPMLLRLASTVQPSLLVLVLTALGAWLAPKVALDAPLVRAWVDKRPMTPILKSQLPPAAAVGLAGAAVLLAYAVAVAGWTLQDGTRALPDIKPPLVTKLLYGGITEELLSRWGLMSLFVWILWRLGGGVTPVRAWCYWGGAALAALLFAAGHLPLLFAFSPEAPDWLIAAVLAGNAVPGLLFGWLFWRRGIEAAMIAHALAHLFATLASALTPLP